jgi:PAS domain S-box-containing protein
MTSLSFASLRMRLLFMVLVAVIPALGLTLYSGLEQRHEAGREVEHDALELAQHAAAMQGNLVDNARQILLVLAQLFQVDPHDPTTTSAIFANLLKQSEGYSNLVAAKPDGSVFASALPLTQPMNLADRPYFQRLLQTRDFTIGEYQIGRGSGKASIVFAHPVFDKLGDLKVVIATALDLGWLSQFVAKGGLPEGATCTVTDRNGTVLARYPDVQGFVGKSMPEAPIIKAMLAREEGTAEERGLDGVERLYGFTPLEYASKSVFVSIGIPKQVAFADANLKLARNLALLGIAALMAFTAAWFIGDRAILRRLNRLLNAARAVAGGNLGTRLGPPYVRGELGQLTMAFDEMAMAIQTRETEARQRSSEMAALLESARAILRYRKFTDSARRIFDSCKSVIGATGGYVALLSEDGAENQVLFLDSGGQRCMVDPTLPMPIRGLREEAYRSGKTVYCNDFSRSEWVKLMPQGHADLDNVLFAPLVVEEKGVGLLGLANKPGGFTENDTRVSTAFGELAAIALFNSRMWESLQESKEQLNQHREYLEMVVERRTAELTETNEQLLLEINERKRVEEVLRLEQHKFREILDSMNDGVCVINRHYGIDYVNPVMRKEFGLVGGRKCYEYFHDSTEVCPSCRNKEVFAGESLQWEWSSDKTGKTYDLFDTPIRNMDGSVSKLEIFRDISGRKQAENALIHNEELLRKMLETLPVGIWILDSDGRIIQGNPAGLQIWAGARYVGIEQFGEYKGWWLATGKRIDPEEWAAARAIMKGETSLNEEIEIECFDGTRKVVLNSAIPIRDAQQKITGAIVVNQDITERVEKEQQHALLATAVEQAAEGVLVTGADWTIQHLNPAFERVSGYTREEAIGQHHRILKSGKHDAMFYQEMRNALECGEVWRGRITSKKKDGNCFEAEATLSPVRDTNRQIVNWVTIARDVTYETSLEKQLRQAQKIEALGTLAGGIAHDFNNILGIIIGFVQLALYEIPKNDAAQGYLEEVFKAANRAKELVKPILAFSRQAEQERLPTQIALIVKEALKMLRASLPSTIEMRENIVSKSTVLADATQIHQVLLNLCTNAAHAMEEKGGVLEVGLLDVDLDTDFVAPYSDVRPGPYLRLAISDTGQGMDADTIERIFDPYFTTKPPGAGTGLGLSVVHGIVKSHGGLITVNSEPGKGSSFQIFLPRIESLPDGLIAPTTSPRSIPTGTERILFVDDEAELGRFWQKALQDLGYQVTTRTSSFEALEAFRAQPDKYDLIITDLTMPKMTGVDLARELLRMRPDIPVILCTGFSQAITQEMARDMGIRELVMKPILTHELAETIRRVLDV